MEVHPRIRLYDESILPGMIPHESELTAGVRVEPGRTYGFFTDTSLCIGCKACEAACKQWNLLPADDMALSGMSYDNTRALSATTWRHVAFLESPGDAVHRQRVPLFAGHLAGLAADAQAGIREEAVRPARLDPHAGGQLGLVRDHARQDAFIV